MAAVWQVVTAGDAPLLAEKILGFDLTVENVKAELANTPQNTLQQAFQTILRNRTFHGGILAAGSGLIKSGEAGKGISSRWYPQTLAKRFLTLHAIRQRLTVMCSDALQAAKIYQNVRHASFLLIRLPLRVEKMRGGGFIHFLT